MNLGKATADSGTPDRSAVMQAMRRWRRWAWLGGSLAAVALLIVWACGPTRVVREKSGWKIVYDYWPVSSFLGPTHAELIILEYGGEAFPTEDSSDWKVKRVITPVGAFWLRRENDLNRYRHTIDRRLPSDSEAEISIDEIQRGYCELVEVRRKEDGQLVGFEKKRGTPEHWCLVSGPRDVMAAPEKIGSIEW